MIQTLPSGVAVVQLNVVVVNETAGVSRNFEYLYPLDQVELRAERMHISTPELTFTGDRNGCTVRVTGKDAGIEVTATNPAPPVLMNGQGQFRFIDLDEQYEFAFPAMPTTGTVMIDAVTYPVTGASCWTASGAAYPASSHSDSATMRPLRARTERHPRS